MKEYYNYDENSVLFKRREDGALTWWFKDGTGYTIYPDLTSYWFGYEVMPECDCE